MKAYKYLIMTIFTIILVIGCGGKEKKKEGFTFDNKTDTIKSEVADIGNNITITANDAMQYNKSVIKVKAGEKVKLTLTHIGKLDKKVMGHNFVLLKQGVDMVDFGNKAVLAAATDYIPKDVSDDVIIHTKLIGGGETTVVEFVAPAAGEYDYICSFPGHYAMMKGKFIVE